MIIITLPLDVFRSSVFEMSPTTREPPQLPLFMHPVLPAFNLSKMRMIHIASPHVVSAGGPAYRYLIIFRRRYKTEETLLKWRAVSLELFSSRKIQAWEKLLHVSDVVTRDVLVELQRTNIHPSLRDHERCSPVS